MNRIEKAIMYATEKHKGQYRHDNVTDYIAHPIKVYNLLAKDIKDENILISALLHDVVEDTDTTHADIEQEFGSIVADIVVECSKPYKTLHSKAALTIKCADLLANVTDKPTDAWVTKKCRMIRKS